MRKEEIAPNMEQFHLLFPQLFNKSSFARALKVIYKRERKEEIAPNMEQFHLFFPQLSSHHLQEH